MIGHYDRVILSGARFKVSEAGRQRVLRERRKNVHAFVTGVWMWSESGWQDHLEGAPVAVTYNPYRAGHFHPKGSPEVALEGADVVRLVVDERLGTMPGPGLIRTPRMEAKGLTTPGGGFLPANDTAPVELRAAA